MTNGEKFKTAEKRGAAFAKFCEAQPQGCNKCELSVYAGDKCRYAWLDLEYNEELKPCPFCGGEAMERKSNRVYYVFCTNCSVKTVDSITQDSAIAAWNRRVSRD